MTTAAIQPVSVFADARHDVMTVYKAELAFHGKLLGGIPKNPRVIPDWIRTWAQDTNEDERKAILVRTMRELGIEIPDEATNEQIQEIIDHLAEETAGVLHTNGFKRNEHGLYIESRQVKAAIKEAVNIHFAGERWGATKKGPRSFSAERVFVQPDQIQLGRFEPDGVELVIGHITDKSGRRATLTNYEFVEMATVEFEVHVVDDSIKPEWWARIWTQVEYGGLGAVRSMGFGTCAVTRWERA